MFSIRCAAAALACLAPASPARAESKPRNAALQVSASDGATEAEALRVEARLWRAVAPVLEKKGFSLQPLGPLHEHLARTHAGSAGGAARQGRRGAGQ